MVVPLVEGAVLVGRGATAEGLGMEGGEVAAVTAAAVRDWAGEGVALLAA